jgi:sulfite exporter TauE/SafE
MVESGVMDWALPLTALTTGFFGSLHCLGMCGGVSGSVALASAPRERTSIPRPIAIRAHVTGTSGALQSGAGTVEANVIAFNAGRIASYGTAGALAGMAGDLIGGWGGGGIINGTSTARTAMFVFANLMIVITGLYLLGVPQLLAPLERAGGLVWRRIAPLTRSLLPLRSPLHAAVFGAVWGWIPCGMVYAMLLTAISAGSAAAGALTMLAFGAGTMPAMIAAGMAAGRLKDWTRRPPVRIAAGLAVVAIGFFGFARLGSLDQLQAFGAYCATLLDGGAGGRP